MNLQKLIDACNRNIDSGIKPAQVAIVVTGKHTKDTTVKLYKGNAPVGKIVQWDKNSVVALFDAEEVLGWIKEHE